MCDPLTIAGAALTAGSTVANAVGARSAAKARDNALAAERIRQGALDQEAQALNAKSQDRFEDFEGQRETKTEALGDYFANAAPETGAANAAAGTATPTSTNSVVTREMAKQSGKAKQFTDQQAGSLASLRAFGDVLGDASRLQARDAGLVGQIGGFKRGSSNIMPLELDAAAQKGAGARFLGDLLGGFGGIALNAGLTKGPAVAAAGGGAAPMMSPRPQARPPSLYPQATGIY